jgi:hypothetical protein
LYIQEADVVIGIGGGKGTADCIEKALLAKKPVFVACAIEGASTYVWENKRQKDYHLH